MVSGVSSLCYNVWASSSQTLKPSPTLNEQINHQSVLTICKDGPLFGYQRFKPAHPTLCNNAWIVGSMMWAGKITLTLRLNFLPDATCHMHQSIFYHIVWPEFMIDILFSFSFCFICKNDIRLSFTIIVLLQISNV